MTLFLGVDGGGTQTRAVAMDRRGRELGRGMGPATLIDQADPKATVGAIVHACHRAAADSGAVLPARVLWAGIAGAGTEPAQSVVRDSLREAGVADEVYVESDAHAAFHDAFGSEAGILLVSGTGSSALGRDSDGSTTTVGGWGGLLGDEGSGYAVGMAALRALVRGEDGRGAPTRLRDPILENLGVDHPRKLIPWIATASKASVAALAPVVCRLAEVGDEVAGDIVDRAVHDLVAHVLTLAERLGPWSGRPAVALTGGLIDENGPLRVRVSAGIVRLACQVHERTVDAARGAAHLAIRAAEQGTGC